MKIAVLTSGVLPVPAVQGGAVENLVDFCLEYNNAHRLHHITIYSVYHSNIRSHKSLNSEVNHYKFIHTNRWIDRVRKYVFRKTHKDFYYDSSVEYYLALSLKKIRKEAFDIILIENRPGYVLKLKDWTNSKLVIHQENDYLNTQTSNYQMIYNSTTCIINTSDYITKQVRTINPHDTKCVTVLNGIDTQYFFQAEPLPRNPFMLTEKDFVIAYSGRLKKEKGILQLIQAIKQVKEIVKLKLLIIGASAYGKDKEPTKYIRQLEEESEPIKDKVIFTGFINYDQMPSYLKMADIAVVPSMWEEPFGLTVVEALAAGLPLITTRSGGIPEICGGVATIIDRENIVENLAAAILDLYNHPEKREQMAAAGLERAKQFDKDSYAKNFFKALEGI